jgi:protein-disulfide isomerase
MAKRVKRKPREQARETNWWLIGGIIVVGVIVIFALLFLALQEPEATTLTQFCLDNPENCIFKGAADAPVSIVEVSDYGCSYCRDFNLETAGLLEDLYVTQGDVDQGRFDEFHRRMFEIQGRPTAFTSDGFNLISGELGLDHAAFSSCLENAVYDSVIQDNIREASLAGVNSTPTFFVNDKKFSGNHPLTTFQDEIASALGTADAN